MGSLPMTHTACRTAGILAVPWAAVELVLPWRQWELVPELELELELVSGQLALVQWQPLVPPLGPLLARHHRRAVVPLLLPDRQALVGGVLAASPFAPASGACRPRRFWHPVLAIAVSWS